MPVNRRMAPCVRPRGGHGNKLKTANTTLDVEQLMAESREPALAGERIATGKAHALTGDRQRLRPQAPCARRTPITTPAHRTPRRKDRATAR